MSASDTSPTDIPTNNFPSVLILITFSKLHAYGRLGNQLFQVATCLGHAAKIGSRAVLPLWHYSYAFSRPPAEVSDLPLDSLTAYHEPCHGYRELPLEDNLDLHGYFQSHRYFEHIADEIRNRFRVRRRSGLCAGVCAIHVRRGDYINTAVHPVMPMTYYEEAMSLLRSQGVRRFRVFSDDLNWCREHFTAPGVSISRRQNEISDLAEMCDCEHFIIANSSFSWWAAYLGGSDERTVVYPSVWFSGPYAHYDTRDMCPANWLKLPVDLS